MFRHTHQSQFYTQMSQEYRQRLLERHLSSQVPYKSSSLTLSATHRSVLIHFSIQQNRSAPSPVDSIPSVEYNSPRYSSPYETYAARESLIDPDSASVEYEAYEAAMPRDTYIGKL
jgi:hypothetical protein